MQISSVLVEPELPSSSRLASSSDTAQEHSLLGGDLESATKPIPLADQILAGRLRRYHLLLDQYNREEKKFQYSTECSCRDLPETISFFFNIFDSFFPKDRALELRNSGDGESFSSSSSTSAVSAFFDCSETVSREIKSAVATELPSATTCFPFTLLQATACALATDDHVVVDKEDPTKILTSKNDFLDLQKLLVRSHDCFDSTPFTGAHGVGAEAVRTTLTAHMKTPVVSKWDPQIP
ncbi:unnamed protein product, partial [Amoebophrya sp. A25]|eukprot:GSA25T00018524001.1